MQYDQQNWKINAVKCSEMQQIQLRACVERMTKNPSGIEKKDMHRYINAVPL